MRDMENASTLISEQIIIEKVINLFSYMKNCKTPHFPKNTTNHTVIREIDENSIAAHNGVPNYIDQKVKYTPEGRNINDFPQNDKSNKIYNGCFL